MKDVLRNILLKIALIVLTITAMYLIVQVDPVIAKGILCTVGIVICFALCVWVWGIIWPSKKYRHPEM